MTDQTLEEAKRAAREHAKIARQWTRLAQHDAGDPMQARSMARLHRRIAHDLRIAIRKERRAGKAG
jgi:hypothetical protein